MFDIINYNFGLLWVDKIKIKKYIIKKYEALTISKWCGGITVPPHLNHCGLQQ